MPPVPDPTGNTAFDAYKADTLRPAWNANRTSSKPSSQRLREAKDKAEFDQFMDDRAARRPRRGRQRRRRRRRHERRRRAAPILSTAIRQDGFTAPGPLPPGPFHLATGDAAIANDTRLGSPDLPDPRQPGDAAFYDHVPAQAPCCLDDRRVLILVRCSILLLPVHRLHGACSICRISMAAVGFAYRYVTIAPVPRRRACASLPIEFRTRGASGST